MVRTVGVEEEMLLVDVRTTDGHGRSPGRCSCAPRAGSPRSAGVGVHGAVEGEFQQQQIETHTAPTADLDRAARARSGRWRSEAVAAAREDRVERRRARHLAAAGAPGR